MAGAAVSVLTVFPLTLVLMAFQLVSHFMLCAADSVLTSFTPTLILLLTRMWVISWQMQLGLFLLLPSLPLWSCFPDSL